MKAWSAILAGTALVAGCVGAPYEFSADRAEAYLKRNHDLPSARAQALREGLVVPGMTREEVSLCLGNPQETSRVERDGQALLVWTYQRRDRPGDELERSGMWDKPIPVARVCFNADFTVASYRVFTPQAAEAPVAVPPAAVRAAAGEASAEPRGATLAEPDMAEPVGGFEGWPELTINGVVLGVGAPYAIINRREVVVGDVMDAVKVLTITARGVTLQRGADVRFLQTGRSTQP
jgi:hypothetical protein